MVLSALQMAKLSCSIYKVCWAFAQVNYWLIRARAYPSFCSIKRLGALPSLDGMLVHCRLPSQLLLVPIYAWLREASSVQHLA
jgi:hypothetical protein